MDYLKFDEWDVKCLLILEWHSYLFFVSFIICRLCVPVPAPVPVSVCFGQDRWGLSPGAGHTDNNEHDIDWGTELD